MEKNFIFDNLTTIILCIACLCFGVYQCTESKKNAAKGDLDNGAQTVVTSGVLCTFLGIAIALLNFEAGDIVKSIPIFLDSMKAAFFTSIIGMGFGMYIKVFIQASVEQKREQMFINTFKAFADSESVEVAKKRQEEYVQRMEKAGTALENSGALLGMFTEKIVPQMKEQFEQCAHLQEQMIKTAENLNKLIDTATEGVKTIGSAEKQINDIAETVNKRNEADFAALNKMVLSYNATVAKITTNNNEYAKTIATMGGAIRATSDRLVDNYNNLINRINELDRFMRAHGGQYR